MQFEDNEGLDLDFHCPLTESMDTAVDVNEQVMPRSDCTDGHAHFGPSM